MLSEDIAAYKMLHGGKSLVNLPTAVPCSPRQWQLRAGWKLGGDPWLRQAQDDEPALNLAFKPHCRPVIHGFTKAFVDPVYAPSQYNLSGKQVPDVD